MDGKWLSDDESTRKNPIIVDKTWAAKITEQTGSASCPVPEISDKTWAGKITEETHANTISDTTNATTITEVTNADTIKETTTAKSIVSTTTSDAIVDATAVTGAVVETAAVGGALIEATAVGGAHIEAEIVRGIHLEAELSNIHVEVQANSLAADIYLGRKLEAAFGMLIETNFGRQEFEMFESLGIHPKIDEVAAVNTELGALEKRVFACEMHNAGVILLG